MRARKIFATRHEPKSKNLDPVQVMAVLYKQTDLESRFSLNMNVLDNDAAG